IPHCVRNDDGESAITPRLLDSSTSRLVLPDSPTSSLKTHVALIHVSPPPCTVGLVRIWAGRASNLHRAKGVSVDERRFDVLTRSVAGPSRRTALLGLAGAFAALAVGQGVANAGRPGHGGLGDKCNTGHQCGQGLKCKGNRCKYKGSCGPRKALCNNTSNCCSGLAC